MKPMKSSIDMSPAVTKREPAIDKDFLNFPEGFMWGAATSHFQIEGHPGEIGKRTSDWSAWCMEEGRISDNTTADSATEFYKRYATDVEICRNLSLNAFRLSLNWPALCPEKPTSPQGQLKFDAETVKFYRDLLTSLKNDNVTTYVTLFHFTLPNWLAEAGGWNATETVEEFVRFAELAAEEFGDLVDYWITLNEPLAYVYQGYVAGVWPPGQCGNYVGAFRAVRNMLAGHARAYAVLHEHFPLAKVSFTMHWRPFMARRKWSPLDQMVRFFRDFVFNQMFPMAVHTGRLEFPFPLNMHPDIRKISGPIRGLRGAIDYLAVNYYTRELSEFRFAWPVDIFGAQAIEREFETNCMGWESYPEGLYNLLTYDLAAFKHNHDGSKREIIITENGYAAAFPADLGEGDWSLADDIRVQYLTSHLQALHHAIEDGANVKGYLYWSLTDNFEWAEGLSPRFGLVRVAYPTQERTLRKSARVYGDIARLNGFRRQVIAKKSKQVFA
jgi:beta-glucosidase